MECVLGGDGCDYLGVDTKVEVEYVPDEVVPVETSERARGKWKVGMGLRWGMSMLYTHTDYITIILACCLSVSCWEDDQGTS